MTRLFRQPNQTLGGYTALAVFALAYLAAMTLVLSPGSILTDAPGLVSAAAENP